MSELRTPTETGRSRPVRSILHATDFSESSVTARRWAVAMARAHGAALHLLHVAPLTSMASVPLALQNDLTRRLDDLAAELRRDVEPVTVAWDAGRPWEAITAEAARHDVVVIGARGHSPFPHLRLGSTADRVLRAATVPVLTIHHAESAEVKLPRRILVPTDFSDASAAALHAAVHLFGPGATDPLAVTILHAWQPLVEYGDMYGVVPTNPYVADEEQASQMLLRFARRTTDASVEVRPVLRTGPPARIIEDEAEAIGTDLIAMGTHGHSGLARFILGSVAEHVVHHVHCPVLTVGQEVAEAMKAGSPVDATAVSAG